MDSIKNFFVNNAYQSEYDFIIKEWFNGNPSLVGLISILIFSLLGWGLIVFIKSKFTQFYIQSVEALKEKALNHLRLVTYALFLFIGLTFVVIIPPRTLFILFSELFYCIIIANILAWLFSVNADALYSSFLLRKEYLNRTYKVIYKSEFFKYINDKDILYTKTVTLKAKKDTIPFYDTKLDWTGLNIENPALPIIKKPRVFILNAYSHSEQEIEATDISMKQIPDSIGLVSIKVNLPSTLDFSKEKKITLQLAFEFVNQARSAQSILLAYANKYKHDLKDLIFELKVEMPESLLTLNEKNKAVCNQLIKIEESSVNRFNDFLKIPKDGTENLLFEHVGKGRYVAKWIIGKNTNVKIKHRFIYGLEWKIQRPFITKIEA